MKIALIGNPNTGKSTLFNQLCNEHVYTSNYCGVTTDIKEAKTFDNHTLIDLPGIYSLTPYSNEETITKDYLFNEKIDCIINIIDINNIRKNLFLTFELLDLNIPIILVLNMMDEFKDELDLNMLKKTLGIDCIPISAKKKRGFNKIKQCVHNLKSSHNYNFKNTSNSYESIELRYIYIDSIYETCIKEKNINISYFDHILFHPLLSYPCLFILLFIIFMFTFGNIGQVLFHIFDLMFNHIQHLLSIFFIQLNLNEYLYSFIMNGILSGVFAILRFIPIILLLFFFFGLLDESGILARISVLMDAPLKVIGLSGKSFFPLFIGFGCSVPAILSTKSIHSKKERFLTIFLICFMSCSAKIPVYLFFCHAFFEHHIIEIIVLFYIFGILMGCCLLILLNKETTSFVMEVPKLKMPQLSSIFLYVFLKLKEFITRTFTIIYISSILIWCLQHFNLSFQLINHPNDSILALFSKNLAFLFIPLGFSDWRLITSLITGLGAKEIIVSSLTILIPTTELYTILTPLSAYSFMIFVLLYSPCIASISAIKQELGIKYAIFIFLFQCLFAWCISFLFYQVTCLML